MRKKFLPLVAACCCAVASFGQASYCTKVIGGYVADWEDASNVNYNQLTHAYFAFIGSDGTGKLCTYEGSGGPDAKIAAAIEDRPDILDKWKKFLAGCEAAHTKKIISVGGYGCDIWMNKTGNSSANTATFVTNIMAFIAKYNLDGVDLDWEDLADATQGSNYRNVITALRSATTKAGKLLISTVVIGYRVDNFPKDAVATADYVQLMAYDQLATWDASTAGNHSTVADVNLGIGKWSNVAANKIVVGVPFYGYQQKNSGGNKTKDWTWKAFYTQYKTDTDNFPVPGTSETIGVNGTATIKEKTAIGYGKGGVMVWEMTNDLPYTDPKSLHLAIVTKMNELCPSGHGNNVGIKEIKGSTIATSYYSAALNQVRVSLQKQGRVSVSIYNVLGQEVIKSDLGTVAAGDYGVDLNRATIKAGVYIVTVTVGDERVSSKVYID